MLGIGIGTYNKVWLPVPLCLTPQHQTPPWQIGPVSISFSWIKMLYHPQWHILYWDILICIQHGACNEKRWQSAWIAGAPATYCWPSQWDERWRRRWTGHKCNPPQPPSLRGWFTSYGLFLLHSAVIERRLDGADCFRHQTSYSQSVGAVTFSAAPYAQLCGCIHSKKRGGKKLYAFPESTLFFSL